MEESILPFSFVLFFFLVLHFSKEVNPFVMEAADNGAAAADSNNNSKKRKHEEIVTVADENSINLKPWLERVSFVFLPFEI